MTTGARVLVCGDRDWDDDYIIGLLLTGIRYWVGPPTYIYHGACRGADNLFAEVASDVFEGAVITISFPADWSKGKSAGPQRNKKMLRQMLDDLDDDQVYFAIALHNDLEKSKGTKHMVSLCKKASVPVYVVGRA